MVAQSLVSSIIVNGNINKIFEKLKNLLLNMDFKELSSNPPAKIEFARGKGGLLTTKIQKCKTFLKVSLKEAKNSNEIDILFDYAFEIPGLFTDGDKEFIQGELSKIHHELFDISSSTTPKFYEEFKKRK